MELYQIRLEKYESALQTAALTVTETSQRGIASDIADTVGKFETLYYEVCDYLSSIRTHESLAKLSEITRTYGTILKEIRPDEQKQTEKEYSLFSPARSKSSRLSNTSSKFLVARYAEAKAALVKVEFAEKEAALKKERAILEEREKVETAAKTRRMVEIDTDLEVLSHRKVAASIKAEVEVLENMSLGDRDSVASVDLPPLNSEEKVAKFICEASEDQKEPTYSFNKEPTDSFHLQSHFVDHLLRKDLLLQRIVQFDDNPEFYNAWKSSFRQVVTGIRASAAEEIDLLIRWLGKDSKIHAQNLKTVHIRNPSKGLEEIWCRLDERFGSPEIIHRTVVRKLENFTKLTYQDAGSWYNFADTLAEIQAMKEDPVYACSLAYFDSSVGIAPVMAKLPAGIQDKWATRVIQYKRETRKLFPPFVEFVKFIQNQATIRNDSCINRSWVNQPQQKKTVRTFKTETEADTTTASPLCPLHKRNHSLNDCIAFRSKSVTERKQFLKSNRICFKCCDSSTHKAAECCVNIKCVVCGRNQHAGAMHVFESQRQLDSQNSHGGETNSYRGSVNNTCTQICGGQGQGRSCAKIVLVNVHHANNPTTIVRCYAILDDQSNRSLVKPKLLDLLGVDGQDYQYTLKSCSGTNVEYGRRASNCFVTSIDGSVSYDLPSLIECSNIPNNRDEICTPDIALNHSHLAGIANQLPELDFKADILILIGRDLSEAHIVRNQIVGPPGSPFAQQLGLGWVIVGEVCLGKVHRQDHVNVYKTCILNNGRPSLFDPCDSHLVVDDELDPVFVRSVLDECLALSIEDRDFVDIIETGFRKTPSGRWSAPLPFKKDKPRLPNNRDAAFRRAKSFDSHLQKNIEKKDHMVGFMHKILSNGHAEIAPTLKENEECWYLPIFGVYHAKKPGQIRGVFDSSAEFQGLSLNSVLLSGPDLLNSLLGVLMRFRKDVVAVAADIEQMFYCFEVHESDRNFLRFFWYRDNDPDGPLVEFRMCRHVFGNSPSPAIATYGLRKSVEHSDQDVRDFVESDFYVDDGLISKPDVSKAVSLICRAQCDLSRSCLRLHKIVSNRSEVLSCFPVEDLAKDLKCLDLDCDLPAQRSLGIGWNLNSDSFVFKIDLGIRPVTKRGVLSTINSVFDPLGFLAPVILVGKLILGDIVSSQQGWDEPLLPNICSKWLEWQKGLDSLNSAEIPRCYFLHSLSEMKAIELHVFSDASEKAISAVAYIVGLSDNGDKHVGFVMGKSKIAPRKGHTIPRLELCAAVLAVEIRQLVDNLYVKFDRIKFYTDSRIVLGYIHNQSRRFFTYVSNRVQKVRQASQPKEWNYVASKLNPADIGSRGANSNELRHSSWLSGPSFLLEGVQTVQEFFPLLKPDHLGEVRCNFSSFQDGEFSSKLGTFRLERFSDWRKLVGAISFLRHISGSFSSKLPCKGWHVCSLAKSAEFKSQTENVILRNVQTEAYLVEIQCLKGQQNLHKDSSILTLSPFLDENGLLRVGGRLSKSYCSFGEKHPIIVPGKSHVQYRQRDSSA